VRRRADGHVFYWVARADLVERGFLPKTQRLWPPTSDPLAPVDQSVEDMIRAECERLHEQARRWARENGQPVDGEIKCNGTIEGLIDCYRRDPDSNYAGLRYRSKVSYDKHLKPIEMTKGSRALSALTARDFKRWYEEWSVDKDGSQHLPRAHARMTMIRAIVDYGTVMLADKECARLDTLLSKMEFKDGKPRTAQLTAAHADAIRRQAHAMGCPSIALAQAMQFGLMARPKDVVGEYVPLSEPGLSSVVHRGQKWLYGIDWREISDSLILTHRLSKSLRGRSAILDPAAGKTKVFDLKLYPGIMEELAHVPPERRVGPLIIDERTGRPFANDVYRMRWREIADAAGVPSDVQCRDSRAGGITEGVRAMGGNIEAVRKAAGHSQPSTTLIYIRDDAEQTAEVAIARAKKR